MSTLRRVPVIWTTGVGGAGVSVFYSAGGNDATASLGAFFDAIKGLFPTAVTWQIPASGDTIESTTGALTGSWAGGTGAALGGTVSGTYAAGTGAYITWRTNTVRNGRKFVGRTFLAPLVTTCYDSAGTITNANLTTIQAAANALITAGLTVVWGRPLTVGAGDGLFAQPTAASVPDRVTSLRSRRS